MENLRIIVLVYNSVEDTLDCLASIQDSGLLGKTLLVDNGSRREVADQILAAYPDLDYLRNEENLGFAGGNNTGIRKTIDDGAEYIFILNNDTVIFHDTLPILVDFMAQNPKVGAIAPVNFYFDNPNQVWQSGVVLKDPIRHRGYDQAIHDFGSTPDYRDVDYLPGSSILFRKDALLQTGLFDEWFFLTYEETDLCFRIKKNGWRVVSTIRSKILHRVSKTFGRFPYYLEFFMLRNRPRFVYKNFPSTILIPALSYWVFDMFLKAGKRLLLRDRKGLLVIYLAFKHALWAKKASVHPILSRLRS